MKIDGLKSPGNIFFSLNNKEKLYFLSVFIYFLFLLFLGKYYTKAEILPNVFIHDVCLGLVFVASFFFKSSLRLKFVELLVLLSIIYLFGSFLIGLNVDGSWVIYIRQFMIFGYLGITYFIVRTIAGFENGIKLLLQAVLWIALISAIVQLFYASYFYISIGESPFFERNHYSPLVVLGVITLGAYCMALLKNPYKHICFILILVLSFTFGHDSAYLSLVVLYLGYYFFKSSRPVKIALVTTSAVCVVLLFVFVNTFTDVNMYWRMIYWGELFKSMFTDGSILYGNGFGVPFLEPETMERLDNLVIRGKESNNLFYAEHQKYVVTPHNSFITLVFHLGITSLALLIVPLKKLFIENEILKNKQLLFLTLALVGGCVWSFFNVILELPHSASYFWLIYFSLAFSLKQNKKQDTDENAI